jgi:hypothetical protein
MSKHPYTHPLTKSKMQVGNFILKAVLKDEMEFQNEIQHGHCKGASKPWRKEIMAKPVREKLPHVQPITTLLIPSTKSFAVG